MPFSEIEEATLIYIWTLDLVLILEISWIGTTYFALPLLLLPTLYGSRVKVLFSLSSSFLSFLMLVSPFFRATSNRGSISSIHWLFRGETDRAYILVVCTISPARIYSGLFLNQEEPGWMSISLVVME